MAKKHALMQEYELFKM